MKHIRVHMPLQHLALLDQKLDRAIYQVDHYPADKNRETNRFRSRRRCLQSVLRVLHVSPC